MTGADIALIITASGTVLIQGYNAWKSGRRDQKLAEVHNLVNSQSEKLNEAVRAGAFADGKADGIAEERAAPMIPSDPKP
jgi:hypothetical protein